MKVLIVEDDAIYASALGAMMEEMNFQVSGTTGDSSEVLRLIKATRPDLVLMDICIGGNQDGVELAEQIEDKLPVIFITSMQEDATFERAKKTQPFAYVTKPVDRLALQRAIQLVEYQQSQNKASKWADEDALYIKTGYQIQKVMISSVYYVQVNQKHITLGLQDKQIDAKIAFKDINERLVSKNFIKVHQSFIINMQKIENVDLDHNLIQVGTYEIPISRRNKKKLLTALNNFPSSENNIL
ncbi:hypothetical protein BKI52_29450 [marine bacterium AO1-C]|nr:hypothetical protein BKI52_29450 [marine bacterium AO1-C]